MQLSRLLIASAFSIITTLMVTQCLSAADEKAVATDLDQNNVEGSAKATDTPVTDAGNADAANPDPSETDKTISGEDASPSVRGNVRDDEMPAPEVMAALQAGPKALSLAFRVAAKRATPSVVVLYAYGQDQEGDGDESDTDESTENELPLLERGEILSPPPAQEKLTGIGSGVIVSQDGLIITNNHVIRNAKRVVVQLPDETRVDANVVRGDPDSDVAMVRVETPAKLQPVEIGDSDNLEIGDWVLAIGSPFKLEATVSAGIISGKNRRIERIKRSSMLQTDAAINPGNSGGALIDLDGKVIGISTAIATRSGFYQGVGFAIPINQARWIAEELDEHGEVRRAAIGTTLVELKPRIARQFNLEPYSGILVYQVIKESVAEKAGIEPLDVIVAFAGEPVSDSTALQEAIERQPIGSMQPITVKRSGKTVELKVELATVDDPTGSAGDESESQD